MIFRRYGFLFVLGLVLAFIAFQARTGIFRRANPGEPANKYMRQILESLGLTLSDFFARENDAAPVYFFRHRELAEVGTGGVSLLQVGRSLVGRPLQVLLETYPPGAETAKEPYRVDGGEEGGVVIEGEIEATIGDEVRILKRFDAYLFPTSLPHKLRNVSGRVCRIVSATTPPV